MWGRLLTSSLMAALAVACASETATLEADTKQHHPTQNPKASHALQSLMTVSSFEGEFVGFAGQPSPNLKHLREILLDIKTTDDTIMLHQLLEKATLPGKIYAFIGLYFFDRASFKKAYITLKNRPKGDKVQFLNGCVMIDTDLNQIVDYIWLKNKFPFTNRSLEETLNIVPKK